MNFDKLKILLPHLDVVFEGFYRDLLSDRHFAGYFENQEQVRGLVVRQKKNLADSLAEDDDELRRRYMRLGELHYYRLIPYVDFLKGMRLLEEGFLREVYSMPGRASFIETFFAFFNRVRAYTARGYLNCMINNDRRDINVFLNAMRRQSQIDSRIIAGRMDWLDRLLEAIEIEDEKASPHAAVPADEHWLDSVKHLESAEREYLRDIDRRIMADARNIFYYLRRGDYEEALPLYTSILNIYKLTLILSSTLALSMANVTVESLKRDPLSGLFNRAAFEEVIAAEMKLLPHSERGFSIIMMDLDHFKNVNDTHGHLAGDLVIARTGRVLLEHIRSSDFAFRIGGEEFVVLLKNVGRDGAVKVAEKIRAAMAADSFTFGDRSEYVTASFGVVEASADAYPDGRALLAAADELLYRSKRDGRNRVTG